MPVASHIAGKDYFPTAAGIIPLAGGGIADGTKIKVSYKALQANVVEWLAGSQKERSLIFHGVNKASRKQVVMEVFRGKFGLPTSTPSWARISAVPA
jgi:transposase